ncbi:hypothetical protein BC830DRAFT_638904 [Chytriomyces sp. MP71]|nr:hypothetical protein BC830DRAFT_638904 [Chytriomyces sp. MP71]
MKKTVRCTRCSSQHKSCDANPTGCQRCIKAAAPCKYKPQRPTRIACLRCVEQHKRCDMKASGCTRCVNSDLDCVYDESDSASAQAFKEPRPDHNFPKLEEPFTLSPTLSETSSHISDPASPVSPPIEKLDIGPSSFPAPRPVSSLNILPTLTEWGLVYNYFTSTDSKVQATLPFTLLNRKEFIDNFYSQPSALWLIVCAYAASVSGTQWAFAASFYNRAVFAVSPNDADATSTKSMQTAYLIGHFALLLGDLPVADSFLKAASLLSDGGPHEAPSNLPHLGDKLQRSSS